MADLNAVLLSGKVVSAPEKLIFKGKRVVAYFVLAVSRAGEGVVLTDFFRVVVKEKNVEVVMAKLQKGKVVIVEGYLLNSLRVVDTWRKGFQQDVVLKDFHLL